MKKQIIGKLICLLLGYMVLTSGCSNGHSVSPDPPNPNGTYLYSVVWSGTQFVAVGANQNYFGRNGTNTGIGNGIIITSPDGVKWTTRSSDTTKGLNSISWSANQFVAVGWGGNIITSPDGVTWMPQIPAMGSVLVGDGLVGNGLTGLVWSGMQFVAVGGSYNENSDLTAADTILTSPDGLTWTTRISDVGNRYLSSVAWSGTQFITVGITGEIMSSFDGVTWSYSQEIAAGAGLYDVIWSGNQFVAVGWGSTIATSPDGVTWTMRSSPSLYSPDLHGVVWSGTQFVAVGGYGPAGYESRKYVGGIVLTSPDGVTWVPRTVDAPCDLMSVAWSGTQFIAVGFNGEIISSTDGVTWTTHS